MSANVFIAVRNLRKKKGEALVLFFMTTFVIFFCYLSISVIVGTGRQIDEVHDKVNAADYLHVSSSVFEQELEETLRQDQEVKELEKSTYLGVEAEYFKGEDGKVTETLFWIGEIEERGINRLLHAGREDLSYDSILLPYYLKQEYAEGDAITLVLCDEEYAFTVAGFEENPLLATPLIFPVYEVWITPEYRQDILEEHAELEQAYNTMYRVRLIDGTDTTAFDQKMAGEFSKTMPEDYQGLNFSLGWKAAGPAMRMTANISMGILLLFSVVLVVITLIVVRYNIRNSIEKNLKNIGILQASGYTGGQLQIISALESSLAVLCASPVGLLLGYLGNKACDRLLITMLGVEWTQKFNASVAVLTVAGVYLILVGITVFMARIYKKIDILQALRGGIHSHNFRRNYFPLDKSRLPFSLVLAGKNALNEKAQNISVFLIIAMLAFATCAGLTLYENFVMKSEGFFKLSGLETADIMVSGEHLDEIGEDVRTFPGTAQVLSYNARNVGLRSQDKEQVAMFDIWSNPADCRYETMLEGRLPEYDNEMVLTKKLADELGVKCGDVIYVTGFTQAEELDYLVVGLDQKFSNMGKMGMLSFEGAERLFGSVTTTELYIYADSEADLEVLLEKIRDEYPGNEIVRGKDRMEDSIGGIMTGVKVIAILFVVITLVVVAMLEIMLIRARVVKERTGYGIQKALGYTTSQLLTQTMLLNVPVIGFGAVAGVALSHFLLNPLMQICFSVFGIAKCSFQANPVWWIVTVAGILLIAMGFSAIAALEIKQVDPVALLTEE